jgi:clan AA aspartic protease
MMIGIVNAQLEAVIDIPAFAAGGSQQLLQAVIDTGYSGFLTLPPSVIAQLNLPFRTRGTLVLADGSRQLFDIYVATVIWDRTPRTILVDAVDSNPLIGMELLSGFELRIPVRVGETVEIVALP